jgi:hypothetical protein
LLPEAIERAFETLGVILQSRAGVGHAARLARIAILT